MSIGFIIFAIGSVILSVTAELTNEFRVFKDVADMGYKINIEKFIEFSKGINPDKMAKNNLVYLFIPWINILTVVRNIGIYNTNKPHLLTNLEVIGVLEEMSSEEKEKYAKKPGILNAMILSFKEALDKEMVEIKIDKSKMQNKIIILNFKIKNDTFRVVYEITKDISDIKVLEITNETKILEKDRKFNYLEKTFKKYLLKNIKIYGNLENFVEAINAGNLRENKLLDESSKAVIMDSWTYFCNKESQLAKQKGVSKEVIALNQDINKILFEILNNDSENESIIKTITYPINDTIFDISFSKVAGSFKDVPYSRQWQLISLYLKNNVIKAITMFISDENFKTRIKNSEELDFELKIEGQENCVIKATVKCNLLATEILKEQMLKEKNDTLKANVPLKEEINIYNNLLPKNYEDNLSHTLKLVRKPNNK